MALHAGGLPGYPESHGCVHLPMGFAQALFAITALGIPVVVAGDAAAHLRTSDSSLIAPIDASGSTAQIATLQNAPWNWAPQKASSGPLTIIVSKADQTIVVLRNGVEIGRSVATIDDDDPGTHVISLTLKNGAPHWLYVALPGHEADEGRELDEATLNRVRMPAGFYQVVKAVLQPGATILVTQSSVGGSGEIPARSRPDHSAGEAGRHRRWASQGRRPRPASCAAMRSWRPSSAARARCSTLETRSGLMG